MSNREDVISNIGDIDDNTIIWRYFDFPKFLYFLCKSQLYFSRSDRFEDSLEGTDSLPVTKFIDYITDPTDFQDGVHPDLLDWFNKNAEVLKKFHNDCADGYKKLTYINCWHINDHQSSLMWKAYSTYTNGVAIKTTIGRLKSSILSPKYYMSIGKINYIDYKCEATPQDPAIKFLYKNIGYKSENELRIIHIKPIIQYDGQSHTEALYSTIERESSDGINFDVNLDILVDKVYISPKSYNWISDLTKCLLNKYGVNKEVVLPDKYSL